MTGATSSNTAHRQATDRKMSLAYNSGSLGERQTVRTGIISLRSTAGTSFRPEGTTSSSLLFVARGSVVGPMAEKRDRPRRPREWQQTGLGRLEGHSNNENGGVGYNPAALKPIAPE